jgi:hypothetical protein
MKDRWMKERWMKERRIEERCGTLPYDGVKVLATTRGYNECSHATDGSAHRHHEMILLPACG